MPMPDQGQPRSFNEACFNFTFACERAANFIHAYPGAAYRTRIDAAFADVKRAYEQACAAAAPPDQGRE